MSEQNRSWQKELEAAKSAGEKAREVLLRHRGRLVNVRMKPDLGLVSEADQESEKVIFDSLNAQGFPYSFLGEETGYSKQDENGRWIVDPLDGTTNYVHGFPFYCISIGLEMKGELVVGYVSAPSLGLEFWATKGGGAFQSSSGVASSGVAFSAGGGAGLGVSSGLGSGVQSIHVREEAALENSFIATGFNYLEDAHLDAQIRMFHKLIPKTHGIRRAGAAALDLCSSRPESSMRFGSAD